MRRYRAQGHSAATVLRPSATALVRRSHRTLAGTPHGAGRLRISTQSGAELSPGERPHPYGEASALASPASAGTEASGTPRPPLPACSGAPPAPASPPVPARPLPAKPPLPPLLLLLPPPPPAPPPTPPSLKSRTRSVPQAETLLSSAASTQCRTQRERRSPLTPTASTVASSEDVSKRSTF